MKFQYRLDYKALPDKQIIELILAVPHNEEAAAYLLHNRYSNLLHSVYNYVLRQHFNEAAHTKYWYNDCENELFIHLRDKDRSWHPLSTFENRSTFGCWLKGVSRNKFKEVLPQLIENRGTNTSLDNNTPERPVVQLPDEDQDSHEHRERREIHMEAIALLEDDDQRFVILKRIEGYNSREIATLLQMRWNKHSIVKYNKNKDIVVPNAAYVDVRTQRAKENLKRIINEIS